MKRQIIVVDDNSLDADVLKNMLSNDYSVFIAHSGEELFNLLNKRDREYSAVLLDIMMPKMDGFAVLKKMRDDEKFAQIPVIVTTALSDEDTQVKCMSYGANGFTGKPFNTMLLKHTLKSAIDLREKSAIINAGKYDELTKIYSREAFMDLTRKMIDSKEAGYYTLSCVDVENFKIINDQYGVEKGDEVLIFIAKTLEKTVEENDGICCRFMGDKFGILFPTHNRDSESIISYHQNICNPPCIDRKIRLRVGRYLVNDLSLSVNSMYDRATLAEQSIEGRYDIVIVDYTESMIADVLRVQKIVMDMKESLKKGEIHPWFQPQYNHATGALVGAEALARWIKDGEFISPAEFIPIFEKNGFIYEMDQYIWEEVCRLMRKWIDEGKNPLPVSVNISRRDLFHKHFINVFTSIIDKYAIPYNLIRVEVTESAFSVYTDQIVSVINKLISLGFTVEIDDFGSAYSSLNTLKDISATILKLDMRFFDDTNNEQRSGNIVESIVRMAKWLGMSVIAEGVEYKDQADYLKSIGCPYIQGYLYAKPMPSNDYEKLLNIQNKEQELQGLKTVKNLNNNAFWDPKSMETLIFNSYVGGACIFEYCNGVAELLRYNDNFVTELRDFSPNSDLLTEFQVSNYMDLHNKRLIFANIKNAIKNDKESTCEVVLRDDDIGKIEYIRSTVRCIASTGDRYLLYCVVCNVTNIKLAEENERKSALKLNVVLNHINNGITAAIIDEDGSEFLFANENYYNMHGLTVDEKSNNKFRDLLKIMHAEDRKRVSAFADTLNHTMKDDSIEYRIFKQDGSMGYIRANITVTLAFGLGKPVQIAIFTDITEEKDNLEKLTFLSETAGNILAEADCEKAANQTLNKLLNFFEADRAYIMEIDYEKAITINSFEVCAPNITPEIDNLQETPIKYSALWLDSLRKKQFVVIDDVKKMDNRDFATKELLLAQSINSIMVAPIWREGELIGYFGVDNPKTSLHKLEKLIAVGDYMAMLLTRRDLNKKIESNLKAVKTLIDDTPCGFCQIYVNGKSKNKILVVNQGFCRLTGYPLTDCGKFVDHNFCNYIKEEDASKIS